MNTEKNKNSELIDETATRNIETATDDNITVDNSANVPINNNDKKETSNNFERKINPKDHWENQQDHVIKKDTAKKVLTDLGNESLSLVSKCISEIERIINLVWRSRFLLMLFVMLIAAMQLAICITRKDEFGIICSCIIIFASIRCASLIYSETIPKNQDKIDSLNQDNLNDKKSSDKKSIHRTYLG